MPAGVAFAEILDEKLGAFTAFTPRPVPFSTPRYTPPHPLLYAAPHQQYRTAPYGAVPPGRRHVARAPVPASPVVGSAPPPRPAARTLTGREQAAFERLTALGARIGLDFSAVELRRAFRTLARRYHPDRHPDSDAAEQARLAGLFADIHDHYRVLARLTA